MNPFIHIKPVEAMQDKVSFTFIIPAFAWIYANITNINGVLQSVVLLIGIIGGYPAFKKGARAIISEIRKFKNRSK